MIRMTWYETQAQPRTLNAKYKNRLFEIVQVEDDDGTKDYHVAEITGPYRFLGAKKNLRHAKNLANQEVNQAQAALIEAVVE